MADESTADQNLERDKYNLEVRRLELDIAKHKFDTQWGGFKAMFRNPAFWAIFAVFVTALSGIYTQNQQAKDDFKLKIAEIVMNSDSPTGSYNRARAAHALFPSELPNNFDTAFDPANYAAKSTQPKRDLINLIVSHPNQKSEIIQLWKSVYPDDDWVDNIR